MEAKFESRYVRTPEIYEEYYKIYSKSVNPLFGNKALKIVCIIIIALGLASTAADTVYSLISHREVDLSMISFQINMVVILILLGVLLIYRKKKAIDTAINREKEMNGGEYAEVIIAIGDECARVCNVKGSFTEISFDVIKYMAQSENLIVLVTQSKICIIIKKDAFTLGSSEELWEFLKAKGIKIR